MKLKDSALLGVHKCIAYPGPENERRAELLKVASEKTVFRRSPGLSRSRCGIQKTDSFSGPARVRMRVLNAV